MDPSQMGRLKSCEQLSDVIVTLSLMAHLTQTSRTECAMTYANALWCLLVPYRHRLQMSAPGTLGSNRLLGIAGDISPIAEKISPIGSGADQHFEYLTSAPYPKARVKSILLDAFALPCEENCRHLKGLFHERCRHVVCCSERSISTNGHTPIRRPKTLVKKGLDRKSALQQNAPILGQQRGSGRIILFLEPSLAPDSSYSLRFLVVSFERRHLTPLFSEFGFRSYRADWRSAALSELEPCGQTTQVLPATPQMRSEKLQRGDAS
jgi:hypothetical protein